MTQLEISVILKIWNEFHIIRQNIVHITVQERIKMPGK